MHFEFLADATHVVPKNLKSLLGRNIKNAINSTFYDARKLIKSAVKRNTKNNAGEDRHAAKLQETVNLDKATVSTHYARLWSENPVWVFRNEDMPAHEIRPKNPDGFLVFKPKGAADLVFARVVHHPGSKGLHVWEEAEEFVDKTLPLKIDEAVRATLEERSFTGGSEGSLTG